MNIQVWSDFLCPYCLLGKKRLENALKAADIKDARVEVKSFLLNPGAPRGGASMRGALMEKYGYSGADVDENFKELTRAGRELGLALDFEGARDASTDRAHALFQYAKAKGQGTAFSDRLQQAGFMEGEVLDDEATLLKLAGEVGIREEEARAALRDEGNFARARAEYEEALRFGARGVPFFVIDDRFAITGAQPEEVFIRTLEKAAAR